MLSTLKMFPRKTIIAAALAVVVIIAGLVLIYYQFSNLRDLRAEVEEEETALLQAREELNRRQAIRADEQHYREQVDAFEKMIPANPEEEEVLRYFDRLAEEYDFRVIEIRFEGRQAFEEQGYVKMPLRISLEGSYRGLSNLLGHLYEGERAVRVDDVRISGAPEDPEKLPINLSANAFYRIQE